jgi:hypothetical protein
MELPPKLILRVVARVVVMVVLAATLALSTLGLLLYSAWHVMGGH